MPYVYNATCACKTWVDWTASLVNVTNSTSPTTAIINSTFNNPFLPPLLLIITFALYLVLMVAYTESPGNSKLVGITAIVLVISLLESVAGLLANAVLNIIIFLVAFFITGILKSG